jgi:hypothetical protein
LQSILIITHIIGAAIGVGGATMSDMLFFRAMKNRIITTDQFHLLKVASAVVFGGMALVVLSGVWLLFLSPHLLEVPRVQAKLTAVLVLMLNGFVLHAALLKYLQKHLDAPLRQQGLRSRQWIFAASGSASIVSWYAAFVLASVDDIRLSYAALVGIYVGIVAVATVAAYFVFSFKVIQAEVEHAEEITTHSVPGTKVSWSMAGLAVLVVVFVGSIVYLLVA